MSIVWYLFKEFLVNKTLFKSVVFASYGRVKHFEF